MQGNLILLCLVHGESKREIQNLIMIRKLRRPRPVYFNIVAKRFSGMSQSRDGTAYHIRPEL